MSSRTAWFIVGLIALTLFAMFVPRFAGAIAILVGIFLLFQTQKQGLL